MYRDFDFFIIVIRTYMISIDINKVGARVTPKFLYIRRKIGWLAGVIKAIHDLNVTESFK